MLIIRDFICLFIIGFKVRQRQSFIEQSSESGFRVQVVGGVVVKTPIEVLLLYCSLHFATILFKFLLNNALTCKMLIEKSCSRLFEGRIRLVQLIQIGLSFC